MNPLLLGPLLEAGRAILDRVIPDKAEAAKAEMELLKMAADGDLKVALAQLEVNAREAASAHWWVAGWRPFVGWLCGLGFAYATAGQTLLTWISGIYGWPPPPAVDTETLTTVLYGMLGLGAMRSLEKVAGSRKEGSK